jgi:hypothetical protein
MRTVSIVVASLAMLALPGFHHPLHISVSDIETDSKNNSLKITTHVFLDDIEVAFRKSSGKQEADITVASNKEDFIIFLSRYLQKTIQISIDGHPQKIQYLGHEIEDNGIWCFSEVLQITDIHKLEVKNSILIETFEDQTNLVNFEHKNKIQSARLDKSTTDCVFFVEE